jgi:hypothetical protein
VEEKLILYYCCSVTIKSLNMCVQKEAVRITGSGCVTADIIMKGLN